MKHVFKRALLTTALTLFSSAQAMDLRGTVCYTGWLVYENFLFVHRKMSQKDSNGKVLLDDTASYSILKKYLENSNNHNTYVGNPANLCVDFTDHDTDLCRFKGESLLYPALFSTPRIQTAALLLAYGADVNRIQKDDKSAWQLLVGLPSPDNKALALLLPYARPWTTDKHGGFCLDKNRTKASVLAYLRGYTQLLPPLVLMIEEYERE